MTGIRKPRLLRARFIAAIPMEERSRVAAARRQAQTMALKLEFNEEQLGRLSLVVTEAATNALIHGQDGEMVISAMEHGAARWVEMVAVDQGPGIAKLGRALAGGASTKGSLGQGLGAIRRLSDTFEIFAPPTLGTAIVSRIYGSGPQDTEADGPVLGAVCRAKRRLQECGDGWGFRASRGNSSDGFLLVVDGVGHGKEAEKAATEAIKLLADSRAGSPRELIGELHVGLDGTRGAAAAAVSFDTEQEEVIFCGVGNISACLRTSEGRQGLTSLNGALGHGTVELQEFRYPWPRRSLLILHSDGISSRWSLDDYPGLRLRHPSLISAVLYRDFNYDHDDATVVTVARR